MPATVSATPSNSGFTFPLFDVETASELLSSVKTKRAVETLLGEEIEACSDYTTDCCESISTNPLVTAVQLAYSQHRPLMLSPDMIWLTILQGISMHMERHGEWMIEKFLRTPEKSNIIITTEDFPSGSPENPWGELVEECAKQFVPRLTPRAAELFTLQFTTTSANEKVAKYLALLSGVREYLAVIDAVMICGIPSICIEGQPEDWRKIRAAIELLSEHSLDWWLSPLRPICDEFVQASEGHPSIDHWKQIYIASEFICGNESVSGWIADLFPYERQGTTGVEVNRKFDDEKSMNPKVTDFPNGLTEVSFHSQKNTQVELIGGFLGIEQVSESKALRPKIGWAVRRQNSFETLLSEISESQHCSFLPVDYPTWQGIHGYNMSRKCIEFFAKFDQLEVRSDEGTVVCNFPSSYTVEKVSRSGGPLLFQKVATLSDGRFIGSKYLLSDDDDSQTLFAFYLADHSIQEPEATCRLISNDFEQVLRWIFDHRNSLLDQAEFVQTLSIVDPADQESIRKTIAPLGRPD